MTENFNALFRGSCYFRLTLLAVSVSVAAFLTDSTASAQTGRHYDIYNQNYTFPVNQKFINVETSGNGGGVNARNSTVYLLDADFDGNAANFVVDPANGKTSDGLGGAIHSLNSELFLRDSVFTDNTAAGLGGAIYFKVENPADVPYGYNQLYSWTTQGYQTLFSGNKQKYDPQKPLSAQNNSITFAGQAGDDGYAYVLFSVDTDENAVLRQEDPMAIDPDSRGLYLYVEKFGAGTWQLGGVSDFTNYTNNTVSFYVQEGTLQFIENDISDNSGVKLYNYSPDISNYFMVYNADLEVAQGVNAAIDTNYFYAENGSRVKLLGNLNLFADVIYFDNSTVLTGSGNLTLITDLTNGGALYFFANTGDFSGNFTVGEGFFGVIPGTNAVFATSNFVVQKGGEIRLYSDIDLYAAQDGTNFGGVLTGSGDINVYASAFAASGTLHLVGNTKDYNGNFTIDSYVTLDLDMAGTFATNKTIAFMDDSALNIRMGKQEPQMKANEIIIGDDVNLSVYGIQQNTKDAYVVLQSNNVIVGTFANEGSSFDYSPADVDYLRTTLAKSNDGKQYLLTSILSWNLTDGTAHGNFTIEEDLTTGTPGKFTIDTALSPSPNRTLTKKGTGTLEIAAQNGNNIGNAVIEDGTLQLTHSQAIGSNKKIFFQPAPNNNSARPVLELDFRDKAPGSEYDFGTQVGATGIGTLVKKGDNTVLLTNTNNNYGDTEIEEGILAITSQSVLGTGKVIFTGGTLQYRNTKVEAFNAELTSKSAGYNILLDTQNNMRITGKVSGDGSLVKTGAAVLTLAGSATYTGDTEVRQGTLAVESRNSIGNGMVILSDGAVFQNTTEMASTNEDLLDKSKERNEVKALRDNVLFDKDIEYSYKGIYNNIILDEDTDGNGIIEINLASAKSRLQLLTTEVAILTADRTQADEIRNDLIRKKGEPGADINDLNKKIAAKDAEIAALTNKINLAGAAIIGLDAQVSVKDTQIAGFNNQIAALDIEIASLLEANNGLTQDFVLNTAANGKVVDGNIIDTKEDLLISGTISGNGMLVKKGADKTLTLSGMNTYSGGTRIDEGTLAISQIDNLGTGNLIFNGGTLKNTFEISRFNKDIVVNSGKNAIFETEANLTINGGTITGKGGLVKTGDAMLTLTDTYSYTGTTLVQEGTLNLTGRIYSDTIVAKDAILRGKGIIAGNVKFESGSIYEWNAGYALADKDRLNVLGIVELNNTTFRAVTAGSDPSFFEYDLNGQEVLRYDRLTGDERFAKIDNSSSPFYIFSLDYSEPNVVKVITHKRSDALPLSDGVAVGLNLAQRRAHRKAFDRIDLSFSNARYTQPMSIDGSRLRNHQQAGGYRGQNAASTSNAWGEWYMRGTEYDSVFFSDNWRMWSFGFQGGFSFYANQNSEFGLTFGIEHPELKNGNGSDKIIANDGFFGLYYGQRLPRNWEFKGYIGGGTQRYESNRFDAAYKYKTKYYGESFQTNIEFSRPLRTPYFVIRPIFGFDLEYAQQESAYENRPGIGAEQRYYSKASMTQLFTKVGLDFHRPINCGDSYFGISYSNMIAGDSQSVVGVYYPNSKMSGEIRSAHLGQNVFTFRVGANHYLGGRDYSVLFWNFTADEYADRAGGKGEFSGTVGYTYRF